MLGLRSPAPPLKPCSPSLPFPLQWSQTTAAVSFEPPGPPADIIVQVASHRFQAHRSVLVAHSSYFKCILADNPVATLPYDPAASLKRPQLLYLTLTIPSMSSKLFSVLLDFMYSSRLRLDAHNVAEVLFGAQVLHIQRAVDICHNFLQQLQRHFGYQCLGMYLQSPVSDRFLPSTAPPPSPYSSALLVPPPSHAGIVRPIPTTGTPAYFSPYQPYQLSFAAGLPPWPPEAEPLQTSSYPRGAAGASCHPLVAPAFLQPTAGDVEPGTRLQVPARDPFVTVGELRGLPGITPLNRTTQATADQPERDSPTSSSTTQYSSGSVHGQSSAASTPFHHNEGNEDEETGGSDCLQPKVASVKAVIDIACCDGPVKFQRVLNENCSLVIMMTATAQDPSHQNRARTTAVHGGGERTRSSASSVSSNSHEERVESNLGSGSCCPNGENPSSASSGSVPAKKSQPGSLYHCIYCKHSFKSRCCYMKHRWRHLNPLTLDNNQDERHKRQAIHRDVPPKTTTNRVSSSTSGDANREGNRKPLEINVPFYPCKLCGRKFPSYYFVHKHRRMCHQKRQRMRQQRREQRREQGGICTSEDTSSDAVNDGRDSDNTVATTMGDERGGEDSSAAERNENAKQ